jgi:hypothetical protein
MTRDKQESRRACGMDTVVVVVLVVLVVMIVMIEKYTTYM